MSKIAGEINAEMMHPKVIHEQRKALFAEMVRKTGSQQSVLDRLLQEIQFLRDHEGVDVRRDDVRGKDWRLHRMTIKCRLCGKLGSELQGAYLTRVNEKGVTGIWECRPVCGSNLPQETLLMMAVETDTAKTQGHEE